MGPLSLLPFLHKPDCFIYQILCRVPILMLLVKIQFPANPFLNLRGIFCLTHRQFRLLFCFDSILFALKILLPVVRTSY